ncbi:MAG: multifunctional CCA addition/repair protein [Gammaproteobacteria bacterium]|nr:multifunctional CCA addition/repair protein [Gammaproteobacteria bacterium]
MKTYLVGGAVRDTLLNLEVSERDWVVVGATPEEMLDLGFTRVGKDFPVFLHPVSHEEYALARTERNTGPGYYGFSVNASREVTLEEDLLRRDLTINAIARDEDGALIDPFDGRKDLEQRLLRHVSPAFAEDPVRILRVARFAARLAPQGFTVAPETQALMREMVDNSEVDALVPERVWQELAKTLLTEHPRRFFEVLDDCGALRVLFPELQRLFGVPQKVEWHPEIDTGLHTLMVLDQACKLSDDPHVRFAAICHDLGKGLTPADILPSHRGHEQKSAELTRNLCARLRIPNDYRDLAVLVAQFHTHCHRAFELKPSTLLKTLQRLDAIRRPDRFEAFLVSCEADARGRKNFTEAPYPQADYFRGALQAVLTVNTRDIAAQGGKGSEIAQRLDKARLRALIDWKAQNPPSEKA